MKILRNQDGIALITALLFTLLCLGMIMTLLYYVLAGTRISAAQKRYRNSLEASYGGTEFVSKAVIPRLVTNLTNYANYSTSYAAGLYTLGQDFGTGKLDLVAGPDLKRKLFYSTASWGTSPASKSLLPKTAPDLTFILKGQSTGIDFKVYTKIVDTVSGIGLLDSSGIDYLDAGIGVSGTSSSTQTPRSPAVYSIEVQGEAAVNPKEKAALSVLYAY